MFRWLTSLPAKQRPSTVNIARRFCQRFVREVKMYFWLSPSDPLERPISLGESTTALSHRHYLHRFPGWVIPRGPLGFKSPTAISCGDFKGYLSSPTAGKGEPELFLSAQNNPFRTLVLPYYWKVSGPAVLTDKGERERESEHGSSTGMSLAAS